MRTVKQLFKDFNVLADDILGADTVIRSNIITVGICDSALTLNCLTANWIFIQFFFLLTRNIWMKQCRYSILRSHPLCVVIYYLVLEFVR